MSNPTTYRGRLKRQKTDGNVVHVGPKVETRSWLTSMTYTELLVERRFCRAEIQRMKVGLRFTYRVDPRGMYEEPMRIIKLYERMISDLEAAIVLLEKEMIKRTKAGKGKA